MEVIIITVLIVLVLLYRSNNKAQISAIEKLTGKLTQLLNETADIRAELKNLRNGIEPKTSIVVPVKEEIIKPQSAPAEPLKQPPFNTPVKPILPPHVKQVPPPVYQPMRKVNEPSWIEKWWRNNPDLEKFIGENLLNKIGIAILVLGIAFFVKYAIDQNWINEAGRVSIGLACGALLIGVAHYLRTSYRSFSSVLAGGGIAVFYFTIAFAFHQYALIPQALAFVIMVVITGFAVALSVLYNRIELAVIAAIGGFLTPFLVSTGQGNYLVLFTYLLILNSGLLALAYFKRWSLLNSVALFFTELIVGGWLAKTLLENTLGVSYSAALLFVTGLYLLFVGMNMINQVKNKTAFKAFDFLILLLLNASYFAAGILLLNRVENGQYNGLFTLANGLINFALARYFFKREKTDKNLLYLLIGLALTFISLTIPVQLKGHVITLFWSAEFVLLFWLYQRSRIKLFHYASLVVAALTGISLAMDWRAAAQTGNSVLALLYTNGRGLITNIVAATAFALYAILLRREKGELPAPVSKNLLKKTAWTVAIFIAYITAIYGVNLYFKNSLNYEVPNVYHRSATLVFIAGIGVWLAKKDTILYKRLPFVAMLCYFIYHLFSFFQISGLRNGVINNGYAQIHLVVHWITVPGTLLLLYWSVKKLQLAPFFNVNSKWLTWVTSGLLVFFFSQEAQHIYIAVNYKTEGIPSLKVQYSKAVLTIVWALCSFGFMWLGMRLKNKTLRIISLSLFCMALLKLFFFDLAQLREGGKIVAFILLGILLLTISFMYQKLKKIIIDDGAH